MNISDNTIETIKQIGYNCIFYDQYINEVKKEIAIELHVFCFEPEYKSYSFKATKKEITVNWILDKIAQKENYISINWNKIFEPLQLINTNFYITSYGIGIETIFSRRTETRQIIDNFLKSKNIEFTNEYSEANWVFRYKISKSKENINRIKNLENENN